MTEWMNRTNPAFPCAAATDGDDLYEGLTKMDYAMIHIMSGMLASGQYNCAADIADLVRKEAYELAKAALSVSENM